MPPTLALVHLRPSGTFGQVQVAKGVPPGNRGQLRTGTPIGLLLFTLAMMPRDLVPICGSRRVSTF
jgi:hypothetical protein